MNSTALLHARQVVRSDQAELARRLTCSGRLDPWDVPVKVTGTEDWRVCCLDWDVYAWRRRTWTTDWDVIRCVEPLDASGEVWPARRAEPRLCMCSIGDVGDDVCEDSDGGRVLSECFQRFCSRCSWLAPAMSARPSRSRFLHESPKRRNACNRCMRSATQHRVWTLTSRCTQRRRV